MRQNDAAFPPQRAIIQRTCFYNGSTIASPCNLHCKILKVDESGWYSQTNHQITSVPGLQRFFWFVSLQNLREPVAGNHESYPPEIRLSYGFLFSLEPILDISWMMVKHGEPLWFPYDFPIDGQKNPTLWWFMRSTWTSSRRPYLCRKQ